MPGPDRTSQPVKPVVERRPLLSEEQRSFLAGEITAEQYLDLAQLEAEEERRSKAALHQRRLRVNVLLAFALLGALVYGATAAIFFISDQKDGTLAAIILSVLFVVTVEVLREVRRRMSR